MTSPRRILSELGLAAQKGRGQNFLADPSIAHNIVVRSDLNPALPVLEIGPGLGALTLPLLKAGHRVLAVEVDRGLADYIRNTLGQEYGDRLAVRCMDILTLDLENASRDLGGPLQVVGNLPYQISTPILLALLKSKAVVASCSLMLQKEMAQRITAQPGGKDYGRLSVLLGYHADISTMMVLRPAAFYPRPQVDSMVLQMRFKENPQPPVEDHDAFSRVVGAAFSQRRKTLSNALRSVYPPDQVREALDQTGINPGRRAETLSIEEFVALAKMIKGPFAPPPKAAIVKPPRRWEP